MNDSESEWDKGKSEWDKAREMRAAAEDKPPGIEGWRLLTRDWKTENKRLHLELERCWALIGEYKEKLVVLRLKNKELRALLRQSKPPPRKVKKHDRVRARR